MPGASPPPQIGPSPTDPVSLRVQIRDGEGVLVLQEKRASLDGRPLAVFIKAAPLPKK